jgi:hypothetical protein
MVLAPCVLTFVFKNPVDRKTTKGVCFRSTTPMTVSETCESLHALQKMPYIFVLSTFHGSPDYLPRSAGSAAWVQCASLKLQYGVRVKGKKKSEGQRKLIWMKGIQKKFKLLALAHD